MQKTVNKTIALLITAISSFSSTFIISSLNVALPEIGTAFKMDAILLSWVATAFLLSSSILTIIFGRLGDIYGRKKIFIAGVVIFILSSVFSIFAPTAFLFILTRILQGVGSGMIASTVMAILISIYPPQERGKALGISVAAIYIGLSAGPFIGGLITRYLDWRFIFVINIILGLIVIALTILKMPGEWAEARGEKFDYIGAIIFSISLFNLIYGFSILPRIIGFILIIAALCGITIFIIWEQKVQYPLLDVNLFKKNRVFAFSTTAAAINYSATYSISFYMSLYLHFVKGFSTEKVGLFLIIQPLVQAVFSPLTGRLSDHKDPGIIASAGMFLLTCGLFWIAFFSATTANFLIILIMILLGAGFALFSSPNTNSVMSAVDKKYLGIASATLSSMRQLGQMFSMGIAMILFALFIGKIELSTENALNFLKAMKTGFILSGFLCIIGIFASMARGNNS